MQVRVPSSNPGQTVASLADGEFAATVIVDDDEGDEASYLFPRLGGFGVSVVSTIEALPYVKVRSRIDREGVHMISLYAGRSEAKQDADRATGIGAAGHTRDTFDDPLSLTLGSYGTSQRFQRNRLRFPPLTLPGG